MPGADPPPAENTPFLLQRLGRHSATSSCNYLSEYLKLRFGDQERFQNIVARIGMAAMLAETLAKGIAAPGTELR